MSKEIPLTRGEAVRDEFVGKIIGAKKWDRVLSPEEIAQEYRAALEIVEESKKCAYKEVGTWLEKRRMPGIMTSGENSCAHAYLIETTEMDALSRGEKP